MSQSLVPANAGSAAARPAAASQQQQVAREALCRRVLASSAPVAMFVAPAGFGKTTAMAQVHERLHRAGGAVAWLTLERSDNELHRFLGRLCQALRPLGLMIDPQAGTGLLPIILAEALSRHGAPFALFLDDFEMITDAAVLQLVRALINGLPPGSRLLIGSRRQPDLGLARLRAKGQLIEVDVAELRFTADESRELLQLRYGPTLSADELRRLQDKTDGWPAALALVALALARHHSHSDFIARFSGSTGVVADYLSEEILARQPAEVREFLLATSVLRHLDVQACQALLPNLNCAYLLERLEASNLCLVPVASESGTWRYHALFADFLRVQLLRSQPEEHARLHLAASAWYEQQGRLAPAIDHAIEGGDHPYAVALLGQHAMQFLVQGRLRLLARWFAAIPAEALREQPLLQMVSVWTAAFTRGGAEALAQLQRTGCEASTDPAVQAHVRALHCVLQAMCDDAVEAYALGRTALAQLPTQQPYADSVLTIVQANLMALMGDRDGTCRLLDAVRHQQGDSVFLRMYLESVEGDQDLQDAQLRQATARFRIAVSASRATSPDDSSGNAYAGVFYAYALYEANKLDQAERLFKVYLPVVQPIGLQDHVILASLRLARVARLRGDVDDAVRQLVELEDFGYRRSLPRLVASARLERARMLMQQGHADASAAELDKADVPMIWARERQFRRLAHVSHDLLIGRLRWALHFGNATRALADIEAEISWSREAARPLRVMTLSLLRAAALYRLERPDDALRALQGVLVATAEQGFVRLVLDEGPLILPVLHALQRARALRDGEALLADHLQYLLQAAGPLDEPNVGEPDGEVPPEPLTPKETQTLHLIAEGYSNTAIAEKLGVSENTVRTHVRSLYAKLNVHSRTQAVARARRWRQLP